MQYVVLLAAILILVGSVFLGYRKGFIRTALGMLALVLSLVIMQLIGPAVGNFLMEDSGLYEKTSRTIAESLKASVDLPETPDIYDIPADMVTPELEAQAEKQALEQTFLPEALVQAILANSSLSDAGKVGVDAAFEKAGEYLGEIVVRILGLALTFLITFVIIRLLFVAAGIVGSVPGIHEVNRILGAVLGALRGLVILWLLCFVVTLLAPTEFGQAMLGTIESSAFLSSFYSGALSFGSVLRLGVQMIQ